MKNAFHHLAGSPVDSTQLRKEAENLKIGQLSLPNLKHKNTNDKTEQSKQDL
jgi:hypothetical protein